MPYTIKKTYKGVFFTKRANGRGGGGVEVDLGRGGGGSRSSGRPREGGCRGRPKKLMYKSQVQKLKKC